MSLFLGLETSCDDTSVALVAGDGEVLKLYKYTKDEDHRPFGGIVPERASRNHLKSVVSLLKEIETDLNQSFGLNFKQLSGIGYTSRPGLLGSLIVGSVAAKTLNQVFDTPLYPVNHLEGHILSPWLYEKSEGAAPKEMIFPHLSLIVSGGHTQLVLVRAIGDYEILGSTRDDAVGEAIDKFSKSLGLGFPGGPLVDKKSITGDPKAHSFPRPMIKEPNYDFSFSGLKASASRYISGKVDFSEAEVSDLCASYLEACIEVLEVKTRKALIEFKPKGFSVVGGVSANSLLRKRFESMAKDLDVPLFIPPLKFCTDNGAMIALVAALRLPNINDQLDFEPSSKSLAEDFYDKR